MHQAGLDVAAFEFICDADGTPYVYDVNTNTNYNSDAEERAGVSAMATLASYLRSELDWSMRTAACDLSGATICTIIWHHHLSPSSRTLQPVD